MDRPLRLHLGDEAVPLTGGVCGLDAALFRLRAGLVERCLKPRDREVVLRPHRFELRSVLLRFPELGLGSGQVLLEQDPRCLGLLPSCRLGLERGGCRVAAIHERRNRLLAPGHVAFQVERTSAGVGVRGLLGLERGGEGRSLGCQGVGMAGEIGAGWAWTYSMTASRT